MLQEVLVTESHMAHMDVAVRNSNSATLIDPSPFFQYLIPLFQGPSRRPGPVLNSGLPWYLMLSGKGS